MGQLGATAGLYVPGVVLGRPVRFLYDTGATVTCLSSSFWTAIPAERRPELQEADRRLSTIGGHDLSVDGVTTLEFTLGGRPVTSSIQVCGIGEDAVLGIDLLSVLKAQWDWDEGKLIWPTPDLAADCHSTEEPAEDWPVGASNSWESIDEEDLQCADEDAPDEDVTDDATSDLQEMEVWVEFPRRRDRDNDRWGRAIVIEDSSTDALTDVIRALHDASSSQQMMEPPGQQPVAPVPPHLRQLFEDSVPDLTPTEWRQLAKLLTKYGQNFSENDQDIGRTGLEVHQIPTGDATPIRLPPRRAPMHLRDSIEEQIRTVVEQGIVEACTSPWAAPLVIVKKKDGSNRICVDYRALNAVTEKDGHPLPRIEDSLDALADAVVYSTLDMTSGYHQVEVAEEDRDKTAFVTGRGHHLRYITMPFGLCNAPSMF